MLHSAMTPGLVNIRKVMEATGGELFDVQDVAHLDAVFSALIQRIKTRYTLGYYTMANGARRKAAQAGCPPGVVVRKKRQGLHHSGKERVLHSLKPCNKAVR